MSARAASAPRVRRARAGTAAARRRRAAVRRRRLRLLFAVLALAGIAVLVSPLFHHAVRELTLPLKHEDVIRQQAAEKHLDPALIAGVIYAESKFRDQTSSAGARGLMQLTPDTAKYIARLSGGSAFELDDLSTPQVNISYGAYYLRYLLDRYGGNTALALAAYNGGETNVDRWIAEQGGSFSVDDIPFPETRAYVHRVLQARDDYAATYPRELGLT